MATEDNRHIMATKGRYGDSMIREVKGEDSHVNPYEAYLIDSYGKSGEELTELFGSGTTNPETGMPEYYSGGLGKAGGLMSAGAGLLTGGAAATTGAILGPLGIGLMAADWIAGAADKAKQSREQIGKLNEGITSIGNARTRAGEYVAEDINNVWEGVGSQLSDIRYSAGESYEQLTGDINKLTKAGKGLSTGAGASVIADAQTNLQDNLTRSTDKLVAGADNQISQISRAHTSEMEDIGFQIKDMNDQIAELEKSDKWYENLI